MPAEPLSHTVIRRDPDGTVHVQHYGEAHVVEGSTRVIEVPAGEVVVIRHIAPSIAAGAVRA